MDTNILLATDLDRTLLPNGAQEESPEALDRFKKLVDHELITLAYVSGRGESLQKEAIETFGIPVPAYAIGDVGTSIFITHDGSWKQLPEWQEKIKHDWNGKSHDDIVSLLADIDELTLQEESKQNTFKVSYYAPEDTNRDQLIAKMKPLLDAEGIQASLIWSIDEPEHTGLMDVLPKTADKLHALQFLREFLGFSEQHTIFCGDSGNDLPVLTSGLQSVLVANARDQIKNEAIAMMKEQDALDRLYIAQGNFLGMNGNYAAGVLEGIAHYAPHTTEWMT